MHRTLVVDDDVDMHNGIKFTFGEEFPIASASSGEEAVRLARNGLFPVVILDLSMSGLSGIETMELLRAAWPYHKFIILTGHPSAQSAIAALNKGAFKYFVKPFSFRVLREAVVSAYRIYEREVSLELDRPSSSFRDLQSLGLTRRESDVAVGILQNKANDVIARDLQISVRTAEKHCEKILAKTGISTRGKLREELRRFYKVLIERKGGPSL